MQVEQKKWTAQKGWDSLSDFKLGEKADLVLAFGNREIIANKKHFNRLKIYYPNAHIVLSSTSGEIIGTDVLDESIVSTAINFEKTKLKVAQVNIEDSKDSFSAGMQLTNDLLAEDLSHVFVISDGRKVNGGDLVLGLNDQIPDGVSITGGLAGDQTKFEMTLVGLDAPPTEGNIIAIGFYGDSLQVGHGSKAGWDAFGPERTITKSDKNVLMELDGKSALQMYKDYLGDRADELPGASLVFPLCIREGKNNLVRTILHIDDESGIMVFAGNMPEGAKVRLMKANYDHLIDGAITAATDSLNSLNNLKPELAIMVSCIGRKLILNQKVEDEIEESRDILGSNVPTTGFYSYGEISPFSNSKFSELHNQTMTITTFTEV